MSRRTRTPGLVSVTHTFTETYEERFARLLKEAIDYGRSRVINKTPQHQAAVKNAEQAHAYAEADIRGKGGV
jgi:hypothetical protein